MIQKNSCASSLNASDNHWRILLTQVPKAYLPRLGLNQDHQLLAALSGSIHGNKRRWSLIKKESFSIIEATEKLRHFLLSTQDSRLFTDHRNLIYVFNPTANDNDFKKYTLDKLCPSAMKLCAFRFMIEHIPGETNIWAEILLRWPHSTKEG